MNDPSAAILTTVARCRMRMQLVAAARRAGITIPLAIVAVELFAVTSAAVPGQLVAIAGGAMALAVAIAALPSILRVPSIRTSAAAIDTRLRLQDSTVTAVQMLDDAEPMARLVVRDAAKRLSSVSPGRVFPFEPPVHFSAALAGALGATVLFVVMTAIRGQAGAPPNGSDGIRSAGAAQSGRMGKPPSNAQVAEGAAAPAAVAAQPKASSQTPAAREDTPIGRESAKNDPAEQTLGRSGSTPRAVDADRSAPARDVGAAAGARDSGRGATGFAERTAAAAGGVSGTIDPNPAAATRRAARAPAPADAAYRDQYRIASGRAQSAVAQERLPARLRTYVKRYFVAIHP
jgi:hypothetical protein